MKIVGSAVLILVALWLVLRTQPENRKQQKGYQGLDGNWELEATGFMSDDENASMKSKNGRSVRKSAALHYINDMQEYLRDIRELVKSGKYSEALERHLWFHNHALEYDESMTGVRLSFALSDWLELGEKYPPARIALVDIRDQKTEELMSGDENRDFFSDVTSLNRVLEQSEKTVSLFEKIDASNPDAAKKYWVFAEDSVIEAERYDLVRKYIEDPVTEFAKLKEDYDSMVELYDHPQFGGKKFKGYNEDSLVTESLKLIEIARVFGDQEAARQIRINASAVVKDPRLAEPESTGINQQAEQDVPPKSDRAGG